MSHKIALLKTRGMAAAVTAALVALLSLVTSVPAHADVFLAQTTRCYPASAGSAYVAVHSPNIPPMPQRSIPGTVTIGDNSQRIVYRPYLQRWTGSAWELLRYGPVFYGTAGYLATAWDTGAGLWQVTLPAQRTTERHYRFGAEIWWLADSRHSSSYAAGLGNHQQWRSTYQMWFMVTHCTY